MHVKIDVQSASFKGQDDSRYPFVRAEMHNDADQTTTEHLLEKTCDTLEEAFDRLKLDHRVDVIFLRSDSNLPIPVWLMMQSALNGYARSIAVYDRDTDKYILYGTCRFDGPHENYLDASINNMFDPTGIEIHLD